MEAFRTCKNPGAEIELFEAVATRAEPPTAALLEIVEKVKLEAALVLSIKALGAIVNPEAKGELKQNNDLLAILSDRAKPERSNLIRWAATATIDKIGFGFLAISEYFSEEPSKIAARILGAKRKILIDLDNSSNTEAKTIDNNERQESIDFWTYGPTHELRSIPPKFHGHNYKTIVSTVVKKQDIYAIKETNKLLKKLEESRGSLDRLSKEAYENEVFEQFCQRSSNRFLKSDDPDLFMLAIVTQGHCLQSNQNLTRLRAASTILSIDPKKWEKLDFVLKLLVVCKAISICDFDLESGFSYPEMMREDLVKSLDNLKTARQLVSRDGVGEHFTKYVNKISEDLSLLSSETNLKSLLTEEQKTDLSEKTNRDKLAKAERKRLEDKENELWHGKNNLEIERDKIHAMKIAIFTSVPQIAEKIDKNLSKRLEEISDWSTPRNDDLLGDHKKSIVNNVKNICHEYHTNNKEQVAAIESTNKTLQAEIDKFKEVESIMTLGYVLMATGILLMFLGNIGAIILGTICIIIFIWIAKRETDRNDEIKSRSKIIAENIIKSEGIQAKVKIIDGLIGSIGK